MLIVITITCAFFIVTDLTAIYQNRQWKLFWVYSAMTVSVCALAILIAADIKVPSPAVPLKNIVTAIFGVK